MKTAAFPLVEVLFVGQNEWSKAVGSGETERERARIIDDAPWNQKGELVKLCMQICCVMETH